MIGPLAETRQVSRRFGELVAVDAVSLTVDRGEVVGLLGANGAGKTTLIKMLLGLLAPSSGDVRILGRPPSRRSRRRLGYMPQGLGLYEELTVDENLRFVAAAFGVDPPTLDPQLAAVRNVTVAQVSLGLRRRAAFAAALCHDPELLVLDEPTSGVGPLGRAGLWDTIHGAAEAGAAVLVTTHHMDEAEQCDRLVVLAAGREVAAGTVNDIVSGLTTVEVRPSDPAGMLASLEEAGLPVLPSDRSLRVPGVEIDRVRRLLAQLDPTTQTTATPSSLEEAFIVLANPSSS